MPTYDYECLDCGEHFEAYQQNMQKFDRECPKCKGKTKRLVGGGACIHFIGPGFYENDYKKKG